MHKEEENLLEENTGKIKREDPHLDCKWGEEEKMEGREKNEQGGVFCSHSSFLCHHHF